jgi:hypothetical protein
MKCNNALIIVITFYNVCRVVHNKKKCDHSGKCQGRTDASTTKC